MNEQGQAGLEMASGGNIAGVFGQAMGGPRSRPRLVEVHVLLDRDDVGAYAEGPKLWKVRAVLSWDRRDRQLVATLSVACECEPVSHHAIIEQQAVSGFDRAMEWVESRSAELMSQVERRIDAALGSPEAVR